MNIAKYISLVHTSFSLLVYLFNSHSTISWKGTIAKQLIYSPINYLNSCRFKKFMN